MIFNQARGNLIYAPGCDYNSGDVACRCGTFKCCLTIKWRSIGPMSSRLSLHRLPSLLLLGLLLAMLAGCFGKGGGGGGNILPPTVSFPGLKNLQYNSTIPLPVLIDSEQAVKVTLSITYREGVTGAFKVATALPGRPNPAALGQLRIPAGGTEFTFWWNAISDLENGINHKQVYIRAVVMLEDGTIGEVIFGPMTVDFTAYLGSFPPQVQGGALPSTECYDKYDVQLEVQGGTPPFEWSLLPEGSHLPYFLDFRHDGRIVGTIPEGYNDVTVDFVARVVDSNPILHRESAGQFSIHITCEVTPPPPCDPGPEISFTSLPHAMETEQYFYECTAQFGEGDLRWTLIDGELPPNMTLDESGLIGGAPPELSAGDYPLTIQVCDSCSEGAQCDTVDVILTVDPFETPCDRPSITTPSLDDARETFEYSATLLAAGGYGDLTWTIIDGALPTGLVLTPGGLITGTPAEGTGGTIGNVYIFMVQVCDSCPSGSLCDSKELSLTVNPPPGPCGPGPTIASTSPLPDGAENTEYNFQFEATEGEGALTWVLENPDGLPAGLTFGDDGSITGTPDAGTEGMYNLDVRVDDSCDPVPQSDSGAFVLNIRAQCAPAPTITTTAMDPAVEGIEYNFQFEASDGQGLLSWEQIGGPDLPEGLELDTTGLVHGVPAPGSAGTYEGIEIQVSDSCWIGSQTNSNLFNLTVTGECAPAPLILTTVLPSAPIGEEYNYQMSVENGEGTLFWELLDDEDDLPADLILSTDGLISGIPALGTNDTYNLHFQVCDSCPVQQCDDRVVGLTVDAPCEPGPVITTTEVPNAIVGELYEFQFEATGGHGELSWFSFGGGLPFSINLSTGGLLSGTPTPMDIQDWNFDVVVQDSCPLGPQTDTANFTLTIEEGGCADPPIIANDPFTTIPAGYFVDFAFLAYLGEGQLTWTLSNADPPLPGTVALSERGILRGITDVSDDGVYTFDAQVCDECPDPGPQCTDQLGFELTLEPAVGCGAGPPEIQDVTIPTPTADGSPYSHTMTVINGDGALSWHGVGLPPNMIIDEVTGEISGSVNPGEEGQYRVIIGVLDSCAPTPQADSAEYIWDIS
jgi:hypothetical protein